MDQETTPSFLPHLSQRFQSLIWTCIDSDLTRSAVFYAERYFAMAQQSHEARHLYATALLRDGQTYSALGIVNIAQDTQCAGCLELKAKCSTALGRFRQAHEALEQCRTHPSYPSSSSFGKWSRVFPDDAAILCRTGSMAMKGNLPEQAAPCFRRALEINPFIWEAFESLCTMGVAPDVDALFPPRLPPSPSKVGYFGSPNSFATPDHTASTFIGWRPEGSQPLPFRVGNQTTQQDLFGPTHRPSRSQSSATGSSNLHGTRPLSSADEAGPATKKLRSDPKQSDNSSKPAKGLPPVTNAGPARRITRQNKTSTLSKQPTNRDRRRPIGGHNRTRSIETELDEESLVSGEAYSPSPPAAAHSPRSDGSWTQEQADDHQFELADQYIYDLTRRFASATRALSTYDCQRCLAELEQLPHAHQQTPWVLAMVGRAHYERADYESADRAYKAVRVLEPFRLADMHIYSSLLWQLGRGVELSFLAQELLNINPRSAEAWMAIGNLFSQQKERSQALTCFRRAIQMNPSCAYAYTLSGHEIIDEDVDKAIGLFQSALRVDARHFNAWYGLGTCYLRSSKLRLAEFHYRKALEIHPNNAVLLGCVGLTIERRGDRSAALQYFNKAVDLCPDNALVRYRRAKICIAMKRYRAAIEDLDYLRKTSPEETNVVFQLARAYRLIGDEVKSAQTIAFARDLAPKNVAKLKKLLETVKDESAVDSDRMDEG